jgi:hypothetical protein
VVTADGDGDARTGEIALRRDAWSLTIASKRLDQCCGLSSEWEIVMDYRWEQASGGEIPSGAWERGHGWEWRDTDDGQETEPLWVARSLAGSDAGEVRLGYARRGKGAFLGGQRQPVDAYEVLLDEGRWAAGEWVDADADDCSIDIAGSGGVACGHATDGTPLYVTLRDREGEGLEPSESPARTDCSFARQVLVAPIEAPAAGQPATVPAAQQPAGADAPAAAAPAAVISVLDCKNELVEITNAGGGTLDLSRWKLHDESSRKGYVFPAGTILASGASVRVRSGPGAKAPAAGELAWKTAAVWNDQGDTAYLEDPAGAVVASRKG